MLDTMENQRKTYTPEFKLKVVLESLQRDTTLEAVCQRFGVSKSMVHRWRQDFQANAANAMLDKRNPKRDRRRAGLSARRVAR